MSSNRRSQSKFDNLPQRHASTPTANYVVIPRTLVCPGQLSRNLSRNLSIIPSFRVQQKDSSKSSFKAPKTTAPVPPIQAVTPGSALVVTSTQGIFEMHLKYLDMSDTGLHRIKSLFEDEVPSIRISWKFLSFERSSIPLVPSEDAHLLIESSVLYKVDITDIFLEYVLNKDLSMELYARTSKKEAFLARGELKLNDVIEYPTNEIYGYIEFCDVDKALVLSNTGISVVYGTLTLWYRLSCDVDVLGAYLNRAGHIYYSPSTSATVERQLGNRRKSSVMTIRSPDSRQISLASRTTFLYQMDDMDEEDAVSLNSLEPTDSDIESFKDALDLVLSRNKALRTTQSEISIELRDRARWLHEESNWKRTLQEHAILNGGDPTEIEWRQWRDVSTAHVKLRNYPSQMVIYEPAVVITVEDLQLYPKSPPIKNERLQKFYVEYSFLTHKGQHMECPVSAPKTLEKIVFNFKKHFSIDPSKDSEDCQKLAEAVKNREDIKFVVVGEPGGEDMTYACCEEVGLSTVNMLELVELETNKLVELLPVYDFNNPDLEIGDLQVRIKGVQAMRRLVLQILAPPDYTILE